MADAEAGGKQVVRGPGGRFVPGQSGNPKGRPAGSRNRVTQECQELLADRSAEVMETLLERAIGGDTGALRLVVERLVPIKAARDRTVEVELAALSRAQDVVDAGAAVIARVAGGAMTMSEGKEFMALLEVHRKNLETCDLAIRIEALEGGAAPRPAGAPVGFVADVEAEGEVDLAGRVGQLEVKR